MKIGADRRGRGHRARQPEMERELRRLGERPDQDQDQRRQIQGRRLHRVPRAQKARQVVRPRRVAQHQDAPDQRQPAQARDRQRHPRALPRLGQVPPVADQQEGTERRQLPEHQQQQQVVAEDDPQHRALEQHQEGEEPTRRILRVQIEPRIQDHQKPDPQDQHPEQQPKPVQPEVGGKADLRHPVQPRRHDLARDDGRGVQAQPDQRRQRDDPAGHGRDPPPRPHQQSGQKRAEERQHGNQRRGHATS